MKYLKAVALFGFIVALSVFGACTPAPAPTTEEPAAEETPAEPVAAENPYAMANVGDFVKYKMVTEAMGQTTESTITMTVTAKDENEVTLSSVVEAMGQTMPATEMKISLTQPYDQAMWLQGQNIEKLAEAAETVMVGENSYDTMMTEYKYTMEQGGTVMEANTKSWIAKNVPLGGMVKLITTTTMDMGGQPMTTTMTMELVEVGSGAGM